MVEPYDLPTTADVPEYMTIDIPQDVVPEHFPHAVWGNLQQYYGMCNFYFTGQYLTATDQKRKLYPLAINNIATFAEKLSYVLIGEVDDGAEPLVKTRFDLEFSQFLPDKDQYREGIEFLQDMVNFIWQQSHGRAIQQEAALVAQYMGGAVFQVLWDKDDEESLIPIKIRNVNPQHFLPIYNGDDPWDLLEGYVIHYISAQEAKLVYGIESDKGEGIDKLVYVERWTKETFSISVDGKYITIDGELAHNIPHQFGRVPLVYIPLSRSGGFFGKTIVNRIYGLTKEFNARMADNGDAVYRNVNLRRWLSNAPGQIIRRTVVDPNSTTSTDGKTDIEYFDMGNSSQMGKAQPEVKFEPAPQITESTRGYANDVMLQMRRETGVTAVADGEDEGSQRSGLTLSFRMWSITSVTGSQRTYFTEGFIQIAKIIMNIFKAKRTGRAMKRFIDIFDAPPTLGDDLLYKVISYSMDWAGQIPRDNEQLINEIALRMGMDTLAPIDAIERFGEHDPEGILERVKEWNAYKSSVAPGAQADEENPLTGDLDAELDATVETPKATGITEDD